MKKDEFIDRVAQKSGVTKKEALAVVSSALEEIIELLSSGDKITFSGFGTFSTAVRPQISRMLPGSKEPKVIPAKIVPKFRPGKNLKDAVAERV